MSILQEFQPPTSLQGGMSEEELEEFVKGVVAGMGLEVGEGGMGKEMGRVMKECVKRLEGRVEGKEIAAVVKRLCK